MGGTRTPEQAKADQHRMNWQTRVGKNTCQTPSCTRLCVGTHCTVCHGTAVKNLEANPKWQEYLRGHHALLKGLRRIQDSGGRRGGYRT